MINSKQPSQQDTPKKDFDPNTQAYEWVWEDEELEVRFAYQIIHKLIVTIQYAELKLDEKEQLEYYVKPDKTSTYVKIFFGTEKERKANKKNKMFYEQYKKMLEQVSKEVESDNKKKEEKEKSTKNQNQNNTPQIQTTKNNNEPSTQQKNNQNQQNNQNNQNQISKTNDSLQIEEDSNDEEDLEPFNVKKTQISHDHLYPQWNEQFEFVRVTENYFTVVVYEKDLKKKHHTRYQYLKDAYSGDNVIGEAKVDFSKMIRKQLHWQKNQKVILQKNGEETGTLNLNLEYRDSDKPPKKEIMDKREIIFYGFIAYFDIDVSKYKDMQPYISCRIKEVKNDQIKKTKLGNNQGKSFSFSEKLLFKLDGDGKTVFFRIIMIDPKTKFQECIGVAFIELAQLKKGDNRCEQPLFMSFRGRFSGTLFFEYVNTPPEKVTVLQSKVDMKDMKKQFMPKDEVARRELLKKRNEMMSQKYYKLLMKSNDGTPKRKQSEKVVDNTKSDSKNHNPQIDNKDILIKQENKENNQQKQKENNQQQQQQDNNQQQQQERPKNRSLDSHDKLFQQKYHQIKYEIKLPQISTPYGKVQPIQKSVSAKRIYDKDYFQFMHGVGMSYNNSSFVLQQSVKNYSVPQVPRFVEPAFQTPNLNKYQGTGLPEEIENLDKRLQKIRKRNYEIYVRDKKLTNPVGKEDFFLMHEKHV